MTMTISVKLPESPVEPVTFPCVRKNNNDGGLSVWFSPDIAFWTLGISVSDVARIMNVSFPAPADTEATLELVAEDGTEFPRMMTGPGYLWLALDGSTGISLYIDQYTNEYKLGRVTTSSQVVAMEPLPPKSKTTITIRDGEISCEIEEADWLPVVVEGCDVVREEDGINIGGEYDPWKFGKDGARELAEHLLRFANE